MRFLFFTLSILLLMACQPDKTNVFSPAKPATTDTGTVTMIPVTTPSGTFRVWTKKFGENPRIKILLLHGGPALTHEYMECFEAPFLAEGFEIYQYDQLGSFYSDQPTDSNLWTLPRFVEEVEQLRVALGLNQSNFYLLGNSWGGILGMEYALKYPQHLKALIVSNMTADYALYGQYNAKLRAQLPRTLLDTLESYEKRGAYMDTVYQQLVMENYYTRHICRLPLKQWPEPLLRSFAHINQPVYALMQGPSEFVPGGRLLGWECRSRLHQLTMPVLTIGARYDTMNPLEMEEMSRLVQRGQYLFCPTGSHLSMWDAPDEYYPGIIQFIRDVDAGHLEK